MSLTITFYNDIKYTKDDFMNRDRDFFGNGVVQADDFALHFPEVVDGTFRVGRGVAWVDGYRIANDSDGVQLEFVPAESQTRIDIVQIGHDDLKSQAAINVKKGVPADDPIEPGADYGFIKLYAIQVPANVTAFDEFNVEDRRELVTLNVSGAQLNYNGAVKVDSLGQAGGVATLGADSKVPIAQLPSAATMGSIPAGTDNSSVSLFSALLLNNDTRSLSITKDSKGRLSTATYTDPTKNNAVVETISLNYNADGTLNYVSDTAGGHTVTEMMVYTSGTLTGTTKTVI